MAVWLVADDEDQTADTLKVFLSSNQRTMAQNPAKKLKVAASPQVAHRKSVAQSVRRKPKTTNTQFLPEYLEIPFKVPNGDFCIVLSSKNIPQGENIIWHTVVSLQESKKRLAKFNAEGYQAVLPTLTEYSKRQFVQVDILFRKSQNFTGPKPRVKNSKRNKPCTKKILTFGGAGVNKIS
jgi:hypothetical protein